MDAVGCIQSRACTSGTNLNLCFSSFPIEMHPFFFFLSPPCRASLHTPGTCWALLLVHSPGHGAGAAICPPGQSPAQRGLEPSAVPLRGSAWRKKNTQKTPNLIPSNGSLSPDPIRKLPSISHYRCALAKRSEMMDSFWVCSNLSNANNYYCRPRTDPIGKMHQGSGEHPWVDGENFVFALVSSFTF